MQRRHDKAAVEGRWTLPDDKAMAALVDRAAPLHAFLRPTWYRAANPDAAFHGFESDGRLIAAFPLSARKMGPFSVSEIAGAYWPFRSIPLDQNAEEEEIAAMLSDNAAREALGKAWRMGPVQDDDPSLIRLLPAAQAGGWRIFKRSVSHSFDIDIAALQAKKTWPSKSAIRQSRNYENRLKRIGEVEYRHATGMDWTEEDRDAMADIEAHSWLAQQGDEADTKFHDPVSRNMWENIAGDPQLARYMFCSIMRVGGTPAAFTFGLEIGPIRYQIANNFNEKFNKASPGRIILTKDFADAADRGVSVIDWGAGDAGYKERYGAEVGAEIVDMLFLDESWLASLATPVLNRQGWSRVGWSRV